MRIEIRAIGLDLNAALHNQLRQRLHFALWRFGERIALADVLLYPSGLRGSVNKVCRLRMRLHGMPDVLIEQTGTDLHVAISRAADRAGGMIARQIARARCNSATVRPGPGDLTDDSQTGRADTSGPTAIENSPRDDRCSVMHEGAVARTQPAPAASLVALVRTTADLGRACSELSELMACRRLLHGAARDSLLGLWIDPRWVDGLPCELRWRAPEGRGGSARIGESSGVEGIWMLCRLDVPEGAPPPPRQALLEWLASTFPDEIDEAPAFVPVFGLDTAPGDLQAELQRLAKVQAGVALAPILQDPASGRLESPPSLQRPVRTRAQPPPPASLRRLH